MSTRHRVAVIGGDGIGPEVCAEALKVVAAAGVDLDTTDFDLGAARYLRDGDVLPDATLDELRGFDAILLGAVGPPVGDTTVPPGTLERGLLLRLRFELDLYVNLRPFTGVPGSIAEGADFVVVRENTEGTYAGEGGFLRKGTPHEVATQGSVNTRMGVERCVRFAFELAERRPAASSPSCTRPTCSPSPGDLWQRTVSEVAAEYPDVAWDYNHVDAACIYLVEQPKRYDVIVTDNLFGDILTDLAGAVSGGIGFAASANLNPARTGPSLFEPVHGAAHDIAGKGIANPLAAIHSAALMLEHLGEADAAARIHKAVAAQADSMSSHVVNAVIVHRAVHHRRGRRHRRKAVADAHHPDREDLDGRRARRLGRRQRARAHPHHALRLGRLRGHPRLPDQPGRGRVPPGRPHPAAVRLGQGLHDRRALHRRADHRGHAAGGAGQRAARRLLPAPARLPRLRRDGPQPAALPGQRLGRRVAVGHLPGRRGRRQRRLGKISSWRRHDPNAVPTAAKGTGMYVNSSLAKVEALKAGYDEAILLAPNGNVSECTGENLFIVRDGVLITPPTSDAGALDGITQDSVETIARDLGYEVRHEPIIRTDLYLADEAFLTGTAAEVVPIRAVDDRPVGPGKPGPITKEIQQTYFATVRGEVDQYKDWLDYVD